MALRPAGRRRTTLSVTPADAPEAAPLDGRESGRRRRSGVAARTAAPPRRPSSTRRQGRARLLLGRADSGGADARGGRLKFFSRGVAMAPSRGVPIAMRTLALYPYVPPLGRIGHIGHIGQGKKARFYAGFRGIILLYPTQNSVLPHALTSATGPSILFYPTRPGSGSGAAHYLVSGRTIRHGNPFGFFFVVRPSRARCGRPARNEWPHRAGSRITGWGPPARVHGRVPWTSRTRRLSVRKNPRLESGRFRFRGGSNVYKTHNDTVKRNRAQPPDN